MYVDSECVFNVGPPFVREMITSFSFNPPMTF